MTIKVSSNHKENYAYILHYLPHGYADDVRPLNLRKPIAQAVGSEYFILLELSIKEDKKVLYDQKIVVGKINRDIVKHVERRLTYDDLTEEAKVNLSYLITRIVQQEESRFIKFYNNIPPINHVLPGKSKYLIMTVYEESKKQKFKNYKDVQSRVKGLGDPAKLIVKRIENELMDQTLTRVFTA